LAEFLASEGYEVRLAKDGGEAMALFASFQPDLVMTDLHMPVLDGEQVLARIRSVSPDTPVMIITAHPSVDAQSESDRLGAANFLNKPLRLVDVLARIDELIG
jgi:DNA-binding response OmpR family regulator